ncbi:MAG TPA: Asp-tRNA(Asn)/Glu-tRNA(Gln) amidotransferase subunit GatC [Candidatus Babeliales bacterium]|jgi:aspartyl/glutamyl-tRNA(Asn/Gln) amidotransferase C subunit|nr:Asp-tRNA(Asn)/Glu-tRNA(Gln) amidotransferase subunit GatC [Candidatus Babeliales bacterium]
MAKVSKDEVIAIARVSHIDIQSEKLDSMIDQLEEVLTYAARVKEITGIYGISTNKTINVYRDDAVVQTDAEQIKACAPERQGDYFVVPIILDSSVQ